MVKVTFKSRAPEYARKKNGARSKKVVSYTIYVFEETAPDETAARIRALSLGWEIVKIEGGAQ